MLSYLIKGVKLFPPKRIDEAISPIFHINKLKNESPKQMWDKLSKRIFLVHSRNDKIIKIKNFIENRDALGLPDENQLVLNKGGHNLKKDELILQAAVFKFLMD